MAQQTIDIGAAPNDGTGDPIRDAFDKCNDNFTELYSGLTGLLDFKGTTDCSANPNYPAALKGDFYLVGVAGKIGGGAGIDVEVKDAYFATSDNAGGTQAAVGASWTVIQGNTTGLPAIDLDDLADVNAPAPAAGDVLTWDDTPGEWVPQALPGAGAFVLSDATDMVATAPSDGDVLTWDSTPGEWVPAAPTGGGSFVLADATDVDPAAPADGDVLTWDSGGSEWLPAAPSGGGAFRGALVTKAADQAAANYTASPVVAWDSEAYDTDSIHDNVTNNARLTVPAGVTKVKLRAQISMLLVASDAVHVLAITKNGSASYVGYATDRRNIANSDPAIATETPAIDVVAGDYFEVVFTMTVDTSITVQRERSWFAMEIIA